MRQQNRVFANLDIFVNDHVWSNVGMCSDFRGRMNYRRGVHTRRISRRLVEEFNRSREREIRVVGAQHGSGDGGEVIRHDHHRSLRGPGGGSIFAVGDKGDLTGYGFVDAGDSGDFGVGRTVFQARVQSRGDL